jgi:hypothetical protein
MPTMRLLTARAVMQDIPAKMLSTSVSGVITPKYLLDAIPATMNERAGRYDR